MDRHILQISAGVGPIEVRRFVARLAPRLEALCAERGLVVESAAIHGDDDAPASVELVLVGDAARVLADELGTHALIEASASRGKGSRKRWYAGVTLHAGVAHTGEGAPPAIDPRDLEISAMRASGPGGQHVNKTSSAIRVRHLPSGITVRVADERSQRANLRRALERLAERIAGRAGERVATAEARRRDAHLRLTRGSPVRTYRPGARGDLELA